MHRERLCGEISDEGVQVITTAFKTRIAQYRVFCDEKLNFDLFFEGVKNKMIYLINKTLCEHLSVKVNIELFGVYVLPHREDESEETKSFNSKFRVISLSTDLDELYQSFCGILLKKAEDFQVNKFNF